MSKETFAHPETKALLNHLDEASTRSGVSRGQAFEDFLHMVVCALSGGRLEEQYLQTVRRHTAGETGKRGCDSLANAFGTLIKAMETTGKDILGDLFQGAITRGEGGQFLTPDPICDLMARIAIGDDDEERNAVRRVGDLCCGSGRLLLAAAKLRPHWEFIGCDIDLRCVRMTTINLALRNRYGWVLWGDSLRDEFRLGYRTGFDGRGVIREATRAEFPMPAKQDLEPPREPRRDCNGGDDDEATDAQLLLF